MLRLHVAAGTTCTVRRTGASRVHVHGTVQGPVWVHGTGGYMGAYMGVYWVHNWVFLAKLAIIQP